MTEFKRRAGTAAFVAAALVCAAIGVADLVGGDAAGGPARGVVVVPAVVSGERDPR
jgi:hypothetical protein